MPVAPREVGKVASVANQTALGAIGTSSIDTDVRVILISQTTAGLTLTLPNPGDTSAVVGLDVVNTGTAAFIMYGVSVAASSTQRYVWSGSVWEPSLASGTSSLSPTATSTTLPGGLIIKSGSTSASSGVVTVTFATAFPTACVSVVLAPLISSASTSVTVYETVVKTQSTSGFTGYVMGSSLTLIGPATGSANWIAVGY